MGTGVSASYGFAGSITEAQWAVLNQHPRGDYVSGCALSVGTGAREVDVASGTVWQLGGYHTVSGATVTLAENTSGQSRIDTVVLAVDYSGDDAALAYVQGTPSASPTPPTLTRTAGTTWQVPLADVTVAGGVGVLASSAIKDVRPGPWIDATGDLQGNWSNYGTQWGPVARRLSGTRVEWRGLIRNDGAVAYASENLVDVPYRWGQNYDLTFTCAAREVDEAGLTDEVRVDFRRAGAALTYTFPLNSSLAGARWISLANVSWDISDNGRI